MWINRSGVRQRVACATLAFAMALSAALQGYPQDTDGERLRAAIARLRDAGQLTMGGALLSNANAITSFYERGAMQLAWSRAGALSELQSTIRSVEADGLRTEDYHLATLQAAIAAKDSVTADLIATDAVIRLLAHLRFGKVNPTRLDRSWNHPAHLDDTPLDALLDEARAAPSLSAALERQRPQHFVYQGLRRALTQLRAQIKAGGWPQVAAGASIQPGANDPRVAAVRARLRASGEWSGDAAQLPSNVYDEVLVGAVKAFQLRHRVKDDAVIGKATVEAMNVSAQARAQQVRVNLERARWVLGGLGPTFVLVNLPSYKAYYIHNGALQWETRVQIGQSARKTPAFRADISAVLFNPTWTVPPTILNEDLTPALRSDPQHLEKRGLVAIERSTGRVIAAGEVDWSTATVSDFRFTQPAGPDNALGSVKFIMPNPHTVFLHDTPRRDLFAADLRTFSSGCIRVEHPLELAARLLDPVKWAPVRIEEMIRAGKTRSAKVDPPMPVVIVYWTASVGRNGVLRFARDVYDYDRLVLKALDGRMNSAVWWPTRGASAK